MALGAALVDRGRVVRLGEPGPKVEGTTKYKDVKGPLFKCRLEEGQQSEGEVNPNRKRVTANANMIYDKKDSSGNVLEIRASDRVEVVSQELGTAIWEAGGSPEPLRKRRKVIGWEIPLRRVEDNEAGP